MLPMRPAPRRFGGGTHHGTVSRVSGEDVWVEVPTLLKGRALRAKRTIGTGYAVHDAVVVAFVQDTIEEEVIVLGKIGGAEVDPPLVNSFNGRTGDVALTLVDVTGVGGATDADLDALAAAAAAADAALDARVDTLEATDVAYDARLDTLEAGGGANDLEILMWMTGS